MKIITLLMIGYLYIPIILFIVGWCSPWVSVPVAACVILAVFSFVRQTQFDPSGRIKTNRPYQICIAFLFFAFVLIACGHGDLFRQDMDWNKHHAVFRDLMNYPWPVVYPRENAMLTYYLGQYIVPAFLAKLCSHSETVLRCAIVVWNAFALLLVYLYLCEHFQLYKLSAKCLLTVFLLCFGGCLLVGYYLYYFPEFSFQFKLYKWLDSNIRVHFAPTLNALRGAFQHVLMPWISCCLFWENKERYDGYLLFLLPMIFSGTFGAVYFFGLLCAYTLFQMFKTRRPGVILKKVFGMTNLLLIPASLIICLYLLGNVLGEKPYETGFGLINMFRYPKFYILFVFSEFGAYYLILMKSHARDPIFWIILAELLIMPFFQMGIYNDLCSRGSIPLRFFLMMYCFQQINTTGFKNIQSILIAAVMSCTLLVTIPMVKGFRPISGPQGLCEGYLCDEYISLKDFPGNPDIGQDDAYNYYTFDCQDSLFWRLFVGDTAREEVGGS